MKIQVLGSGCPTCHKLHELVLKAVKELGLKDEVKYLYGQEGVQKIIEMGVMQSPVLAINGRPIMTGFTPDVDKIKEIIKKEIKTK